MPTPRPYGSWPSPISADLIVGGSISLGDVDVVDDNIYWVEGRPSEKGRRALVRRGADGNVADAVPADLNVRTRVHEYGGVSHVVAGETIYVQNDGDQRLYRIDPGATPRAITPDGYRYADLVMDGPRARIVAVREDHTDASREAVNTIVALDPDGPNADGGRVLVEGSDFVSNPRVSPDGTTLAYLSWNHPDMPWDAAELWLAQLDGEGNVGGRSKIGGGTGDAAFQPEWTPSGDLIFVAEETGWWNLYRWRAGEVEPLHPMEAEFGMPLWVFGMSAYTVVDDTRLICAYKDAGTWSIGDLDLETLELTTVPTPFTEVNGLSSSGDVVGFVAGSPTLPASVYRHDLRDGSTVPLRSSHSVEVDPAYVSTPEHIVYPTSDDQVAHGYYYPPTNPDASGPAGELPPLIVMSHGGPTSGTSTILKLSTQFWTSRGFAVLDVDYRGSTGYGRAYREALKGTWGVYDVDDCIAGARFLVERGDVDANRLAIRGGSASGYTTLAALTFHDVFAAGASHYGIGDLEAMTRDTHKFESRYLDRLIGPYPEAKAIYEERSPIHAIDRLSTPLILFQGLEDKVVPPNQAQMMFDAVAAKGVPVALVMFEGEQHGFRQAANIKRALEGELAFYARIFGFQTADAIEPVPITNLD